MPADSQPIWNALDAIVAANGPSGNSVADILAKFGTPSTSVAILDDGEIEAKCYSTIGNDTETVFQCCSISKPVAAMAVMKLVSQGQLSIDEPITAYLPASTVDLISTPETVGLLSHVTLKHLMSHTSGMSVSCFPGYASTPPTPSSILSGTPLSNTPQVHLYGLPGERFNYSGGGITVIQLILEAITGKPFAEIVETLVLTPLQMTRSFYFRPDAQDNHACSFYTGYQKAEVDFHVYPEQAAAGLWTTPTDLLKVVRAMQDSLLADHSNGFLPQKLARKMLEEISNGMALSWAAKEKGEIFSHSGSNFGFRCYLYGYADLGCEEGVKLPQRSGICVMTNSEEGYSVCRKVLHALTFAKQWPTILSGPAVDIPFRTTEVASGWHDWIGRWGNDWEIVEADNTLAMKFKDLPPTKLYQAAMPVLSDEKSPSADLVFEGLEMMARLKKLDEEAVVEIWHGPNRDIPNSDITILRRV